MAKVVPPDTPVVWVNADHPSVSGEAGYYTLSEFDSSDDHTNAAFDKKVAWVADVEGEADGHFEYEKGG